jgi:ribosome-binding protein aMBF1 (putative translation factor)
MNYSYTSIGIHINAFPVLASLQNSNQKSKIDSYIVNKVREMRLKNNLSQTDIAVHLNLSVGFVGHIESPKFRAKYNTIHINELAKLFDCSPKEFLPEKPLN